MSDIYYETEEKIMKLLHKLAFVTSGIALSFGMINANSAQAADLTYDFTVQTSSGGTYGGFFSFDPSAPSTTKPFTNFSFDFIDASGANKTYTLSDLGLGIAVSPIPTGTPPSATGGFGFINFGSKPIFVFNDGSTEVFGGAVDELGGNSFSLARVFQGLGQTTIESGTFTSVEPRSVPEPGENAFEALAVLGLGGVLLNKRLAAKKQQIKVAPLEFTK